jgi:hypothetical protein
VAKKADYYDYYDVFLSFRRNDGDVLATVLRDSLTEKGYKVFFDAGKLNSGKFNPRLLRVIENCANIVVVLSKGSLDDCVNDGDRLRRELAHALKHDKHIITIALRDFEFPKNLPDDIAGISDKDGIKVNNNEYFVTAADRLADKLQKSKLPRRRSTAKRNIWVSLTALILIVAAVVIFKPYGNPANIIEDTAQPTPTPEAEYAVYTFTENDFEITTPHSYDYLISTEFYTYAYESGKQIAVLGDMIYFEGTDGFYSAKLNGEEINKLSDDKGIRFQQYDDKIFFLRDNQLCVINPKGNIDVFWEEGIDMFCLSPKGVLTFTEDRKSIMLLDYSGGDPLDLNILGVLDFISAGNKIIFTRHNALDSELYEVCEYDLDVRRIEAKADINGDIDLLQYSDDGYLIFAARDRGQLYATDYQNSSYLNYDLPAGTQIYYNSGKLILFDPLKGLFLMFETSLESPADPQLVPIFGYGDFDIGGVGAYGISFDVLDEIWFTLTDKNGNIAYLCSAEGLFDGNADVDTLYSFIN